MQIPTRKRVYRKRRWTAIASCMFFVFSRTLQSLQSESELTLFNGSRTLQSLSSEVSEQCFEDQRCLPIIQTILILNYLPTTDCHHHHHHQSYSINSDTVLNWWLNEVLISTKINFLFVNNLKIKTVTLQAIKMIH